MMCNFKISNFLFSASWQAGVHKNNRSYRCYRYSVNVALGWAANT